jgi:predicted PurR-regulated permease PerM
MVPEPHCLKCFKRIPGSGEGLPTQSFGRLGNVGRDAAAALGALLHDGDRRNLPLVRSRSSLPANRMKRPRLSTTLAGGFRLFLTQLALKAIFSVVIGLGLAIIGLPSASLWGLLAMILRFVSYIGAILAAALPIALAAAVGSDWTMVLWTIALFALVEPLTGQVVDPLVCGRTAGLSPVATVVAASFGHGFGDPWGRCSLRH